MPVTADEIMQDRMNTMEQKMKVTAQEDEAWKVAQLAATLTAGWFAEEDSTWKPVHAVRRAKELLAEARRQASARPASEGRADG